MQHPDERVGGLTHNSGMSCSRSSKPACHWSAWRAVSMLASVALVAASLFLLPGCASAPVPEAQLAESQTAVQRADAAGAGQFAPNEMRKARRQMDRARDAADSGDNLAARRSAELANAYAELAEAQALAERAAIDADRAASELAREEAEAEDRGTTR